MGIILEVRKSLLKRLYPANSDRVIVATGGDKKKGYQKDVDKNFLEEFSIEGLRIIYPFVERANPHGFTMIYDGLKYTARYRQILDELQGNKEDENYWLSFLNSMNIGCEMISHDQIVFDFSDLTQTGLMFKKGRLNTPIQNMKLHVRRVRRNFWELAQ